MKKIVLLMLALVIATVVMAEGVTPQQALEQARSFMQKREAAGSRMRKAPGAVTQLTLERQVSGLYLFNVVGDAGYVIVSNDDRTTPILGFSDSGHVDADNMPDNMRAWLQGYADEIAWLQQHPAATDAKARGQRRVGSRSTNPIGPLVTTTWNQGAPYNNECQYMQGYEFPTGCVATAMAQAMYYTEQVAHNNSTTTITSDIPNYIWKFNNENYQIPGVAAETTINWGNMIADYSHDYTSAQATAVAQLMSYCGKSVEMQYGVGGSSASSSAIATALKNYFGYKETTQFVQRKLYSSAKWADLIYFELAHNRPVIYSGQSSGGGHEFVCDGYQYDDGDYFHINWGWGGLSDTYYVLSALLPEHQGTGGSSSNDGYNYDQDAIIGIQKSTDTGEMSGIAQNDIDLQLNSMTLSSTDVVVGNPVTITLNITNNSEDDFEESTIYVGRKVGDNYSFLVGDDFAIPAGQNQACEISYTPTATGTYDLVFWGPNANGGWSTNRTVYATLTVVATEKNLPSTNLTAVPTNQSALISWTGHTDNYKVQYRTAATGFSEDFESGLDGWTIYTLGEAPYDDGWFIGSASNVAPHGGSRYICAFSWNGSAFNADNWLITPKVKLQGFLRFWEITNVGCPDSYEVRLSTTGTDIADFTTILRTMTAATGSWSEVEIDLSAYAGLQGYIAIRHLSNDCNYLAIDDFSVGTVASVGEWQEVTTTESPATITGLTANTDYEYRIVGLDGSEVASTSEIATFTTAASAAFELTDNSKANSGVIAAWNGRQATVTLARRTLYKDGEWNTICLPFNVTLAGSPLAGATAKTLTSATMSGTTVGLTFGSAVSELVAGTPYIIKWDNDTEHPTLTESDLVFNDVTIDKTDRSILNADGGNHVQFIGYYDAKDITAADDSIYYMTVGNTLKHTGVARTLNACRAYFQFSENIVNSSRQFVLDFGDDHGDATRLINNEELIINNEAGVWYSIDGMKLSGKPTRKGVYIKNGKLVVIK